MTPILVELDAQIYFWDWRSEKLSFEIRLIVWKPAIIVTLFWVTIGLGWIDTLSDGRSLRKAIRQSRQRRKNIQYRQ